MYKDSADYTFGFINQIYNGLAGLYLLTLLIRHIEVRLIIPLTLPDTSYGGQEVDNCPGIQSLD